MQVRSTLQAQFKGIDHPVTLYDISGIAGPYHLALPDKPAVSLVTLAAPLPIACFPVEGKIVSETALPGTLTRLAGVANAEATIAGHLAVYTNVKLMLEPPGGPQYTDVYAKVVASESVDTRVSRVRLEFTALPDDAKALLSSLSLRERL